MSGKETAAVRTRDEVADAIRGLPADDWGRLRKVAAYYARIHPIEAEDRALAGDRNCPAHIDVVKFLTEAMRSIAHGEKEKGDRQPTLVALASHGAAEGQIEPADPRPNAEQGLASDQVVAVMKTALLAIFEDDPIAQLILEGRMEGMQGEELRELIELDATAYESKLRLLRRRIDRKFPEGWKP